MNMRRSRIGYTSKTVPEYYSWNPGGFGCSGGCEGCWSRKMASRMQCDRCLAFEVHLHSERLSQPAKTKKPGFVLVNFTCDTFDKLRPDAEIKQMWDLMFAAPQHTFILLTQQPARMADWITHNAYRRDFGWTDWGRTPVGCGDYRHLDDIHMRNICGWGYDGEDHEWGCAHPDNDEGCHQYNCPLASTADTKEDHKAIGIEGEYEFNDEGYAEDCEWMKWHARIRNGAVGNTCIGVTARDQYGLYRALRAINRARNACMHVPFWLSLEPLQSAVNFNLPCNPSCPATPKVNWLERHQDLQDGGHHHIVPYISGVIVGHDNRKGAPGTETLEHIRSVVQQCTAAGVPCYTKQLWIDGKLRHEPEHFPVDLRTRQLPWEITP